jgi:flagellar biosynthesis/type III secretory pathway M-ring protein FliF/YscJ
VPSPKTDNQPKWLEAIDKYRNVLYMALGGLLVLSVLIRMGMRMMPGRAVAKKAAESEGTELEVVAALREAGGQQNPLSGVGTEDSAITSESRQLLAEAHAETAERIRQLAQKDPSASANVIRMWLHNQKA